jgi:hypothetical protein
MRIRIPGFDIKYFSKKILFFKSRTAIHFTLNLHEGRTRDRKGLEHTKEKIQHFKTWNFVLYFYESFLPSRIRIPTADPDPVDQHQCSGSRTARGYYITTESVKPNPQPWLASVKNSAEGLVYLGYSYTFRHINTMQMQVYTVQYPFPTLQREWMKEKTLIQLLQSSARGPALTLYTSHTHWWCS